MLCIIGILLFWASISKLDGIISIINLMMAICFFTCAYNYIRTFNQLSEEGQDQFWYIIFRSKLSAGRECFTSDGWNHWNLLRFTFAAIIILFICRSILEKYDVLLGR